MNRMKIAVLAFAVLGASVANAQDAPKRDRHRGGRGADVEHMFHGIDLTEAQRAQLRAIRERHTAQLRQLNADARTHMDAAREARQRGDTAAARSHRDQARTAMEATRAQREQIHTQMRTEVRAILTPAQQQQLDARHDQRRERMDDRRERMRDRRGGGEGRRGPRGR